MLSVTSRIEMVILNKLVVVALVVVVVVVVVVSSYEHEQNLNDTCGAFHLAKIFSLKFWKISASKGT